MLFRSDLKLTGKAENGEYSASGGSDIKAYDLILNQLECSASGGSDIYTHVTDYIKASASGGSDAVSYTHLDVYKRQGRKEQRVKLATDHVGLTTERGVATQDLTGQTAPAERPRFPEQR